MSTNVVHNGALAASVVATVSEFAVNIKDPAGFRAVMNDVRLARRSNEENFQPRGEINRRELHERLDEWLNGVA